MDVRAKQRLCYLGLLLPRCCVAAVSPHVISGVNVSILEIEVVGK